MLKKNRFFKRGEKSEFFFFFCSSFSLLSLSICHLAQKEKKKA